MLQNKAAALGADYVQVVRVVRPGRMEGLCLAREFVIDGIAYRARR